MVYRFSFLFLASSQSTLNRSGAAAIVIGGDGTLRAVAERLMEVAADVPLLIVPMGTANLMGRHLGIAWDDEHVEQQVLDALQNGRQVHIDTATANGRLLLLVAG